MGFSSNVGALLKKEWLYWRRNMCCGITEMVFPFFILLLLCWAKGHSYVVKSRGGPEYSSSGIHAYDMNFSEETMGGLKNLESGWYTWYTLGLAPNSSEIVRAIEQHLTLSNVKALTFESDAALLEAVADMPKDKYNQSLVMGGGLSFSKTGADGEYAYKLYTQSGFIDGISNNIVDPLQRNPLDAEYHHLEQTGMLYLKTLADSFILKQETKDSNARINYAYVPMPYPEYSEDYFSVGVYYVLGYGFLLSVMFPLVTLIGKLMNDKTTRMRETMRIVGITDSTYFTSYFVFYGIMQAVIAFIGMAISCGSLFPTTNYLLLSLFFFLFGLAIYPIALIMCALFQRPSVAKIIGFVGFFLVTILTAPFVSKHRATLSTKLWVSLLPQDAFFLGLEDFTRSEEIGSGITFSTVGSTRSYGYSLGYAYGFLLLDFVLYMIVALYMDNVLPTPGGVRKSLLYFLSADYWCPRSAAAAQPGNDEEYHKITESAAEEEKAGSDSKVPQAAAYEPVGQILAAQESQQRTANIRGLRKVFDDGKAAVDGLDLQMYTGQIFVLLGHNGAGKTTTISMLTGMLQPTSGQATAFGLNIFKDLVPLRKELGVCTQHDAFFDQLTVDEHMDFYGRIKGLDGEELELQKEKLYRNFKLEQEVQKLGRQLSGGCKRKLSVALSFLGNPRLVMLDEPTSGMDTTMRQELWNMLAMYKRDRVILLTTHYMDEADNLGDRIGIMVQGKLICCGSSMFLKKRYGIGYNLSIIKNSSAVDSAPIIGFVKSKIDNVETGLVANEEIELRLPFGESAKFKGMFEEVDKQSQQLGVKSYGISVTTLEDVFIRVGEQGGEVSANKSTSIAGSEISESKEPVYSLAERAERSISEQFRVVFLKRTKEHVRSLAAFLLSILLPLVLVGAGVGVLAMALSTRQHTYSLRNDFPGTSVVFDDQTVASEENRTVPPATLLSGFAESTGADVSFMHFSDSNYTTERTWKVATYVMHNPKTEPNRYGSGIVYEANNQSNTYSVITLFNLTCPTAALAFSAEFGSQILYHTTGAKITTTIAELPVKNKFVATVFRFVESIIVTALFALGLGLMPGLIGSYLVREYEKELRAHILLAGLPEAVYWLAYYAVDVIYHSIPAALLIAMYRILNLELPYAWVYLVVFPFAQVSFVYLTNLPFSKESSVFGANAFFHSLVGMFLPSIVLIFRAIPETSQVGLAVQYIFSFIPSFSMVMGILAVTNRPTFQDMYNYTFGTKMKFEDFDWYIGGQPLTFLIMSAPGYLLILFLYQFWGKSLINGMLRRADLPRYPFTHVEDDDVKKEAEQVEENGPRSLAVCAHNLSRTYKAEGWNQGKFLAVYQASFGVHNGEIFALLGVNGAGKTTTFKMLMNEVLPTRGRAYVCGKDVAKHTAEASTVVGYCPQTNVLYDYLTVEEHFALYAAVKGIPSGLRRTLIAEMMEALGLTRYRAMQADKLSGGTKRKLSVALALLGNPPVVLLDEPSTGIDPQARRQMWDMILRVSRKWQKCAVVLTTHSMEEAEALSTRLAIMVNGTLRCIGPTQYIKNKFALGFCVEVKFRLPEDSAVEAFAREKNVTADLRGRVDQAGLAQILSSIGMDALAKNIVSLQEYAELRLMLRGAAGAPLVVALRQAVLESYKEQGLAMVAKECGETRVEFVASAHYKYRITHCKVSVGYLFGMLEEMKTKIPILDYSVMQTTLEEVFHLFAKLGQEETDHIGLAQASSRVGGGDLSRIHDQNDSNN